MVLGGGGVLAVEVRGEESIDRGECSVLMGEEWLYIWWAVRLGVGGSWWSGGGLLCTVCALLGAVLFTRLGGGWLFTVCIVGAVLFTEITGRCWCCTV